MIAKVQEKTKALQLRRQGYSYQDILKEVKVSKSSLSLWLNELPLTNEEESFLKTRKDSNISRGRIRAAVSNRMRRVVRDGFITRDAKREFEEKRNDPFFILGIALYWAEGAKRNWGFAFTNSDAEMMMVMVNWIEKYLGVKRVDIRARLYTHKPFAGDNSEEYWSEKTGIPMKNFGKTIYKQSGLLVKKRPDYRGCLRIELNKVLYLRKVVFWHHMLFEQYGK